MQHSRPGLVGLRDWPGRIMMAITSDMQGSLINRYSSYLREGFRGHQTTNREQKQCIYPFCPDLSSLSGVGWFVSNISHQHFSLNCWRWHIASTRYLVSCQVLSSYGRVANLQTTISVWNCSPLSSHGSLGINCVC